MTKAEFFDALGPVGKFLDRIGIAAGVLLLILWMIWRAGAVAHETIAMPVINSHLQYLRASEETQERQAATLELMAESRAEQTQILREISEGQREILDRIGGRNPVGAAQ